MASQQFSLPFRAGPNGTIAKVDQASDAGLAEQVAHLVYTRKGEREMCPTFGITDPLFASIDRAELEAGLTVFAPSVVIADFQADAVQVNTQRVQVTIA